jgi:hypothetical protein
MTTELHGPISAWGVGRCCRSSPVGTCTSGRPLRHRLQRFDVPARPIGEDGRYPVGE